MGIPYSSDGRSSGSQAEGTRFEPRQRHIKVGPTSPGRTRRPGTEALGPKVLVVPARLFFGAKSRLFNFDLRFWRRNKPRQKLVPLTKLLHSSRSVDFRCYLGLPLTFRFSVLMGPRPGCARSARARADFRSFFIRSCLQAPYHREAEGLTYIHIHS